MTEYQFHWWPSGSKRAPTPVSGYKRNHTSTEQHSHYGISSSLGVRSPLPLLMST